MYPFDHKYPGSNLHEIDLAYTLEQVMDLTAKLETFIKYNKLEIADPFEWNIASQYRTMTLVKDPESGMVYVSIKPVPAGVEISDTRYWMYIGYGEADPQIVERLQQAVIDMQSDIDDINAAFDTINADIDSMQGDLDDAEMNIDNLTAAVSGQGNRLTTAENDIDNINTRVTTNTRNITSLTERMTQNETDIANLNNNKVSRDGDVMTGSLGIKSDNLDADNPPATTQNGEAILFKDADNNNLGAVRVRENAEGQIRLRMFAQEPGGQLNELGLSVKADGTKSVEISDPDAWKQALNYMQSSDTVRASGSAAISVASGSTLSRATLVRFGHIAWFTAVITCNVTTAFTEIGTIPELYRPANTVDGGVGCFGSNVRFLINSAGSLQVSGSTAYTGYISINAVWYIP